uniref:Uncharacterized protein n=1 Tax=Photinus pyralis TaxID=7054 RepID=A0A1Y1KBI0_PHOPY
MSWMVYAEESWTKSVDFVTAVRRLKQHFSALAFDAEHEAIYGRGEYSPEECQAIAAKYELGEAICDSYLSYKICDECIIRKLRDAKLEQFSEQLQAWKDESSESGEEC